MKSLILLALALFCVQIFAQPDSCSSNPCQNGGRCEPSGSTFTCTCFNGFHGSVCQYSKFWFFFS